jgi:myo-inositol-1(or 4)-monophosphatase
MKNDEHHLAVAVAAAKEAGRIQKRYFSRSLHVDYKSEINPVTKVDKLCEDVIVQKLRSAFPNHDILTEETDFEGKGSPFKWIVDPLDGTSNYIHGYPCFCVSIALEIEGEIELGVVYDPNLRELFHALKGSGASMNGKRISVSRSNDLDTSLLGTGFPYDIREYPDFYLSFFRAFMVRTLALRRPGSAVLDLCYVASGRFDGFWEMKLYPWDMAAGCLLITEAGGRLTDFQGGPHSIHSVETLASNGLIHDQMLEVMKEVKSTIESSGFGVQSSESKPSPHVKQ